MKNAAARRSLRTSSDNEDWTRRSCRRRPVGGSRGRRHVASKRRVADNLLWEASRSSPSSMKPGAAMGTKISLNYCVDEASGMTANLTEECLAPEGFPVTLELTGVASIVSGHGRGNPNHRGNLTRLGDQAGVVTGQSVSQCNRGPLMKRAKQREVPEVQAGPTPAALSLG